MSENKKLSAKTDLDHFEVFPWNRNFETGHAVIDEQHQILVTLLNKLAKTLVANQVKEVNTAFDALAEYANMHFDHEESIWADHFRDDAWLTSHQMSHAAFLPKVIEIKSRETDKSLADVVEHIIKFLIRWLAFHIIDSDKRMAIALDEINRGKSLEEAKAAAEKKMSGSMRVLIETILAMYDGLSSRALELMRERHARIKAEEKLKEANRRLAELSVTDQLTGLYNRRYFDKVFNTEIRRARREQRRLTYILIDIDYFKRFNDTYGHLAGDTALEKIGKTLLDACRRPGDLVFRLGGEEFGILATHLADSDPDAFGEIIRSGVEALQIPHSRSDAGRFMTVSAGLVNRVPGPEDTVEKLAGLADKRLYRAKAQGRNRVVTSD